MPTVKQVKKGIVTAGVKGDKVVNPCKKCDLRDTYCHTYCNKYKEFWEFNEEVKRKKKEDSIVKGFICSKKIDRNRNFRKTYKD